VEREVAEKVAYNRGVAGGKMPSRHPKSNPPETLIKLC
jgi:hypothetical protein